MSVDFKKLALFLALSCLSCYERGERYFRDLSEARAAGAVERGWVPGLLPKSAFQIRERHDLDTNEVWGAFRFNPSESATFLSHLSALPSDITPVVRSPGSIPWWPKHIVGEIPVEHLAEKGFLVRREDAAGFFFAINVKIGEGYFWSGPR